MSDNTRRVVVTGLGVMASNGMGRKAFWEATRKGISGIKPISRFPNSTLPKLAAGEVSDFLASDYIDRRLANRTDRMTHFAFAAVQDALRDARLVLADEDPHRVGAVVANTLGGEEYVLDQLQALHTRGSRAISVYTAIAWLQVANVGQLSIHYGLKGYCKTPVNDVAGGLDALGMAASAVRRGQADVIIAGGCEAFLHPYLLLLFVQSGQMASGKDAEGYRPFDRRAQGLLMAEGAGICILEEYEHALKRGATIYGEIVGYGQSQDALGYMASSSDGTQYARAIRSALKQGELTPQEIGYFSLDGRAQPDADQAEAEALHTVFGADLAQLPVSVPRTMFGHSYAAAGAIDTVTALLALQHKEIPPTVHCEELDERYGLQLVRNEAQTLPARPGMLIGGRSFGGANVVLALRSI